MFSVPLAAHPHVGGNCASPSFEELRAFPVGDGTRDIRPFLTFDKAILQ